MPFSYGLPATNAYPQLVQSEQLDQETVLIQGIVDCLFFVDGKQYLLDYKSDRVHPHMGGISALTETYRFQLELYATAVEDITGVPVEEKWLYFIDSGDAVKL
ncbi:ATP-dependent helicase/nuclease subunit A [compost metagenome]